MMKEERGDTVLGNETILDSDDLLIRQNGGFTECVYSERGSSSFYAAAGECSRITA